MMTEVVEGAADRLWAGMGLEVAFREGVPVFRPRGGGRTPVRASMG